MARFRRGDAVVYRMPKYSRHPGPRARSVQPAPHGDEYSYEVEKFWVVAELKPDDKVLLQTRRGKTHVIDINDHRLRRANWWERFWYSDRFPSLNEPGAESSPVGQAVPDDFDTGRQNPLNS